MSNISKEIHQMFKVSKSILFVFLAVYSLTAKGQQRVVPPKIIVGISFSPDYNFRALKNNNESTASDIVIKKRKDIEIPKFGYSTGLNICFNLLKELGLETGIQFSDKGYKTEKKPFIFYPPDQNQPVTATIYYSYQYLGIPVKARFTAGKGKFRFITAAGLTANLLLKMKQTFDYEYADGKKEKHVISSTSDFNSFDISPFVSVGVQYKINNEFLILAEPVFRYGVIATVNGPVKENLWNAGLNVGIYYSLPGKIS